MNVMLKHRIDGRRLLLVLCLCAPASSVVGQDKEPSATKATSASSTKAESNAAQSALVGSGYGLLDIGALPKPTSLYVDDLEYKDSRALGPLLLSVGNHRVALGEDPKEHVIKIEDGQTVKLIDFLPNNTTPVEVLAPMPSTVDGVLAPDKRTGAWILGGVSLALAITGATLGYVANDIAGESNNFDATTRPRADYDAIAESAQAHVNGANVAFALAGTTLTAAIVMWLLDDRSETASTAN